MAITNTLVTNGFTTIFTATTVVAITTIMFCNTNIGPTNCELDVHIIPAGQVPSTATFILKTLSLPSTETFVMDAEKLILNNGDYIVAKETANIGLAAVAATVSSVDI
jgi:hypothetical protein